MCGCLVVEVSSNEECISESEHPRRFLKDLIQDENFEDDVSIWESKPLEIYAAKIQILDKISGKVFRQKLQTNMPVTFGSIKLTMKRCFQNNPEDSKEICAFIEIVEKDEIIFSKWLFASSPSVNLFIHPVYDVRVEF
jgi:hypothetical protein